MHHSFDIVIAEKFGVNVAIFLNNLAFWIKKNQANNKHFYDGRFWTYNSSDALTSLFPYWSPDQIDRLIKKCSSLGLVVIDNFNEKTYDRTRWYGLTDKGLEMFNMTLPRNRGMETAKSRDPSREIAEPIPDIKPDIKPDKRERTRKNRAPAPLSFEPDKQNQELAARLGVNIETEVESFKRKKPSSKWCQSEFEQWLKLAKEFKEKHQKNEPRCTIQEYGPGHPHWEARQKLNLT